MGFHTSHVWKTTNAGLSWTDFSANLPDVPVNSIIVDSGTSLSNGTVYVGTDIGVFGSSAGVVTWSELAPVAGQPGVLPNVAVTSLQIFNSGGLKRLRAATYGRGIWEWNLITTPDFQIQVTNNPATIFAGQIASFDAKIYSLNKYSSLVGLSCAPGSTNPPQICTPLTPVLPSTGGTPLAVNVGGAVGDYLFDLHAVGSDPLAVTHDFALALHIVDFSLAAPLPASVSVAPGATSGNSLTATLNVTTSVGTPLGTFPIIIAASTLGQPAKTQTLTLNVSAAPDYQINILNPSLTSQVNVPATFNGTLTAINGYASPVNLSCGTQAPPSCVASPLSVTPISSGASFAVTLSSNVPQTYNFNIQGAGTDALRIPQRFPVTLDVRQGQPFDFVLTVTPASISTRIGQSATFSLDLDPGAAVFPNDVLLTASIQSPACGTSGNCGPCPPLSKCVFSQSQIQSGKSLTHVTFTVPTTGPIPGSAKFLGTVLFALFPLAGMLWLRSGSAKRSTIVTTILALTLPLPFVSCGGGLQGNGSGGGGSGSPGTPIPTYTITFSATSTTGSPFHSAQVTLTVTP